MNKTWLASAFLLGFVACGSKQDSAPPPPQPSTGAPIAFEVTKVVPGEAFKSQLDVRAYNFSDKPIAGYWVLVRYQDASGQLVKVKPGTPFEAEHDHWSFSGNRYKCSPKTWCSFKLDPEVPAGATKAEMVAKSVRALKSDGITFEEPELWKLEGMDWPATAK